MKLMELHILQSFPATCLNRDDLGAPKTAFFGGVQRARVSSQCWKRAIRTLAQNIQGEDGVHLFDGVRTRKAADDLGVKLKDKGFDENDAIKIAQKVCNAFLQKAAKDDAKNKDTETDAEGKAGKNKEKDTKTLLYFSPGELEILADAILKEKTEKGAKADYGKAVKGVLEKCLPNDAADIAIFGRMVSNDASLTLEGAGLFSHALSTHRTDLEIDFFTAVDDKKDMSEDAGAGMMGTLEFNSACYYRYVGLNLDLLEDHLKFLSEDERKKVVEIFVKATVLAVPSARKNTMFGWNPPAYVMGVLRTGQPISLINAFEKPVSPKGGFVEDSIEQLKSHWERLNDLYCLKEKCEKTVELPPDNLDAFISKLT